MAHTTSIDTGKTLSVNFSPGEDLRFPTTSSDAIFTFGNFKMERGVGITTINTKSNKNKFSNFSNLGSLSAVTFEPETVINTKINELNPKMNNPLSYSYFGSFYTKVATSINNIISNYPYAITSKTDGIDNTLYDYVNDTTNKSSSFKIPLSALTNQGNIIFISGNSVSSNSQSIVTLYDNQDQFGIQISGDTGNTIYRILTYSYTTGNTGYMNFSVKGMIYDSSISATTTPIYIRPTQERFSQYKRTISNLEYQLLFNKKLLVVDPDDNKFVEEEFEWPKNTDGFNIDITGTDFDNYQEDLLSKARLIDDTKTDIMLRTMIPENYLELDSQSQIYRKLMATFAHEFDNIKQYIDSLAFAHTVNYKREESIPDKFIHKLGQLLGFEMNNTFNDSDLFEYLTTEDSDGNTYSDYNLELWNRILVNINWLFKKKGTRDAIMFIFKIIGAPECLINFNEFVYTVRKTAAQDVTNSPKINEDDFIEYDNGNFVFQQGGSERGNGQAYINQWDPEFKLDKVVDNLKISTGDTETGTQNILNTKEIEISLTPAKAIECDVKDYYDAGNQLLDWSSTGITYSGELIQQWQLEDFTKVIPANISGMTVSQWLDFVYTSSINPRNRKTLGHETNKHVFIYSNLKKIYLSYMLLTSPQSNRLTFKKLDKFLTLIERNFQDYIFKLLPATTIIDGTGVVIKNTIFNRHRFIYKPGINDGSEFQKELPPHFYITLPVFEITPSVNDILNPRLQVYEITPSVNDILSPRLHAYEMAATVPDKLSSNIQGFNMATKVRTQGITSTVPRSRFSGNPTVFSGVTS